MNPAVNSLVTSIAADAPPPSEGELPLITAPDPNNTSQGLNGPLTNTSGEVDSAGTPFDPAKHEPRKTNGGLWRKKRGRGAGGPQTVSTAGVSGITIPGPPPPPPFIADAAGAVAMVTGGLAMLMGKQWLPSEEERGILNESVRAYMEVKGGFNLPPEIGLAGAFVVYGATRFHHENTKAAVSGFFGKIALWWKKTFGAAKRQVATPAVQKGSAPVAPLAEPRPPAAPGADDNFDPMKRKMF